MAWNILRPIRSKSPPFLRKVIMNSTQAGRLLTLASFLRTEVPRKNFDMSSYWKNEADELEIPDLAQHKCGTSACAMGWATRVWPNIFKLNEFGGFSYRGSDSSHSSMSVRAFFGLDFDEACDLFGYKWRRTPKQEASEIEKTVKKHGFIYAE